MPLSESWPRLSHRHDRTPSLNDQPHVFIDCVSESLNRQLDQLVLRVLLEQGAQHECPELESVANLGVERGRSKDDRDIC